MAGGGALNKIFPGYKDKIWSKLPSSVSLKAINPDATTPNQKVE